MKSVATVRADQRRAAPWPYDQLDVPGLRAAGRAPVPFQEFVLKIHQRCNLACDYCYVYEHADQSWRERPRSMSRAVWQAALARIAGHVRRHGLGQVRVVLHGGEPLLFGVDALAELAGAVRAAMPASCRVELAMQTNGVLLDERAVAVLVEHGIRAGVSVDGVAADHDRHRRWPSGRGSFRAVERALTLLRRPQSRAAYAGVLCTVAPETDPIATYEQLLSFAPPAIDLLLPHANWDDPPRPVAGVPTPYADWLVAVFDRWYGDGPPTRVRLFEDAVSLVLGGAGRSEQLGLSPCAVAVIESDGAIEQVDALKSAYQGAAATGLNVLGDELDDALDDPGVVARQLGRAALADQCRLRCRAADVCGGGHYAHRYRGGAGFRQPSVYCRDLHALVRHVHTVVTADLARLGARPPAS